MKPDARPAGTPRPEEDAEVVSVGAGDRDAEFQVVLSEAQVQGLVHQLAASRGGGQGLLWVLLALGGVGERVEVEELKRDERYQSGRISHSVVLGLVVLGAFVPDEAYGVKSLADVLGMTTTTTWRFLKTWEMVGVLEETRDRRYQLARHWMRELSKDDRSRTGVQSSMSPGAGES